MKQSRCNRLGAGLLVLGLALALPAHAQMGGQQGMDGPGAQKMGGVMRDMAEQMKLTAGHMSQGKLSAAEQKQTAERLRTMATMLDRISGMVGKGMTMDADMQKQMDQMRKQMDDMMQHPGGPSHHGL